VRRRGATFTRRSAGALPPPPERGTEGNGQHHRRPPDGTHQLRRRSLGPRLGTSTQRGTITASVVVTSANGASKTIDLQPKHADHCLPEGTLYLGAPDEAGKEAAQLGSAPFRYDVTLVLDSVPYRGAGTWPDDQMSSCSPCTALRFTPPLPAL